MTPSGERGQLSKIRKEEEVGGWRQSLRGGLTSMGTVLPWNTGVFFELPSVQQNFDVLGMWGQYLIPILLHMPGMFFWEHRRG